MIGRNFFAEIAPCTVVPEFYGRFRQGVLTGNLNTTFEFIFDFDLHPVQVRIAMRAAARPDEYWILIDPVRELAPRDPRATHTLVAEALASSGQADPPVDPQAELRAVSFDFSRCDLEPISVCGTLQPFGCLLVLDPNSLDIQACSANTAM